MVFNAFCIGSRWFPLVPVGSRAKLVARPFLDHFVFKTNGFSMILNFFYSMAPVGITFLFPEYGKHNKTNGFQ